MARTRGSLALEEMHVHLIDSDTRHDFGELTLFHNTMMVPLPEKGELFRMPTTSDWYEVTQRAMYYELHAGVYHVYLYLKKV